MNIPSEHSAIERTIDRLEEILDDDARVIVQEQTFKHVHCDAIVSVRRHKFALEWKRYGNLGQVAPLANRLKQETRNSRPRLIPLISVPYMSMSARSYCEQLRVAWLDLSGNSFIRGNNLLVRERGAKNLFRRRGPTASAFGPKSSRITRWLLQNPGQVFRQREIAEATGLDEGYTSRVIRKLLDSQLVVRRRSGIEVVDPAMLLEAWNEAYSFAKHTLIPGHISSPSGPSLARELSDAMLHHRMDYAMTGLPAAWFYTRYASFRLVTVYLEEVPSESLKRDLGFREEGRGANTWFVVPNDLGVFDGRQNRDGVRCAHPLQVYLDLQEHPERSIEAAEELQYRFLDWKPND